MQTFSGRNSRFTMIELLVVMGIMVMLASIIAAGSVFLQRKGKETRTRAQMQAIEQALTEYYSQNMYYPPQTTAGPLKISTLDGMVSTTGKKLLDVNNTGEAYSELFTETRSKNSGNVQDAWTMPFYYYTGTAADRRNKKTFDLWSMGRDRKHGAGGSSPTNALTAPDTCDDITNWKQN